MRRSATRLLAALASSLGLGSLTAAEPPTIYKWVDSNGIAHYTTDPERIPSSLRHRIRPLERETRAAETSPTAVPQPVQGPARPEPAPAEATSPEPAPPGPTLAPVVSQRERGAPPPTMPPVEAPTTGSALASPPQPSPASDGWAARDATPRLRRSAALLSRDTATPEELEALAAEREALDTRIAAVEAEIARDESELKDLISDPAVDREVPLFDRPEFLEISRRLPVLQAQLQELRDERAKLEIP